MRALAAGADALLLGAVDGERRYREVRAAVTAAVESAELPLARLEEAAERVRGLSEWAASPRRVDAEDGVGLEAARRAVDAEGPLPLPAAPFVVELRGATNLAVGEAHWSLGEPLEQMGFLAGSACVTDAGPVDDVRQDVPLVIACRDAYRQPWQRAWLDRMLEQRPDAVVVAMGLPNDRDLAGETFVATYGAGLANAIAAAELLSGRAWSSIY